MTYTITLPPEYDKALALLILDSTSTAEALIESAAMSMLQSRVQQSVEGEKAALIDAFTKADPNATKADILAAMPK